MHPEEILTQLLAHVRLNAKRFSEKIGLARPDSIYHILRSRNGISQQLAERICMAFPEVSRAWLLSGEGPMLRGEEGVVAPHTIMPRRREPAAPLQQVPLYDLEAVAGLSPIFAHQNLPIEYISIPDLPRCDGAVYVRGDSMYPLLKSGDIVIYKQIHNLQNILWGEMHLISFNYEDEEFITVKFIKRVDGDPGRILLVSHNPHHAPKEISIESVRALALVKASIRYNTMG